MDEIQESHKKYAVVGVVLVVLIGFLVWGAQIFFTGGEAAAVRSLENNSAPISVESVFDNKIVYTTDASYSADIFQEDCEERGGEFNQCGSFCDDGESCAAICAYTCEF